MAQQDTGTFRTEGAPQNTPRLRLKRKDSTSGTVDGAWWPHSDDHAGELPDLLTVLSVRLGPIMRVTYHRAEWAATLGKVRIGDNVVRLDGFDRQPVNTVGSPANGVPRSFCWSCQLHVMPKRRTRS